jgi:excisionase family DNA binding protein
MAGSPQFSLHHRPSAWVDAESTFMSEDSPWPRFMRPSSAAELLGVSVDDAIALVLDGQLRGARLGSPARWRIDEESLAEFRERRDGEVCAEPELPTWHLANSQSFPELWGGRRTPEGVR